MEVLMLSNRRLSIPLSLAVIAIVLAIGTVSPLFISKANNSKTQTTVLVKMGEFVDTDPAPISIEKVFVEGKEIKLDEVFLASPGWAKTIEVDLKNVSEHTLVEVAIQVSLNGESVDGEPGFLLDMFKGSPHFMSANIPAAEKPKSELLVLKPGETTRLNWGEAYLKSMDEDSLLKSYVGKTYQVRLFRYVAINADTKTGWLEGQKVFQYTPGKWYPESTDWSDPKIQKSLDPNYKSQPRKESMRFDEGSNQYVLDSGGSGNPLCIRNDDPVQQQDCNDNSVNACPSGEAGCVKSIRVGNTECGPGSPNCRFYDKQYLQCSKFVGGTWVLCNNCRIQELKTLGNCLFP
jgi:hypothetical protein